ncbi:hypothetical protein HERIO_2548 [Hepatospora eriocheir]|uniref:Uncharacterized protein n=1 Tax=Hepatospora eriocheir TaxID=1081669 RepID=A0A1X0Q6I1_9MICR|nr:hypothetical protein HERIO_2548 [Hepatospora eriocheir]
MSVADVSDINKTQCNFNEKSSDTLVVAKSMILRCLKIFNYLNLKCFIKQTIHHGLQEIF